MKHYIKKCCIYDINKRKKFEIWIIYTFYIFYKKSIKKKWKSKIKKKWKIIRDIRSVDDHKEKMILLIFMNFILIFQHN